MAILLPITTDRVSRSLEQEADRQLQQVGISVAALIAQTEDDVRFNAEFITQIPEVKAAHGQIAILSRVLPVRRQDLGLQEVSYYSAFHQPGDLPTYYGGPASIAPSINNAVTDLRNTLIQDAITSGLPTSAIFISNNNSQIIGVAPIISSINNSSVEGVIVAARIIDNDYLATISNILATDLTLVQDDTIIVTTITPNNNFETALAQNFINPNQNYSATTITYADNQQYRLVARPLIINGINHGYVIVTQPLENLAAVQENIRLAIFILAASVTFTGILIGIAVFFAFARPLVHLAEATKAFSHGNLKQRLPINYFLFPDEITTLVANFNSMAENLDNLYTNLEEQVRERTREAVEANQAKGDFLANMSHEIRTPMNAVIGMTGLLIDTPLNEEQQDFVRTIRYSGDALLTIINDILDFSKIEAGKLNLEYIPFDLRECVESSLDLIANRAAEKGIDLAYLIDEQTPGACYGDVTRLRQILVNLLSNATKFTKEGHITIKVATEPLAEQPTIPASIEPQPDRPWFRIQFSVNDTGIGIPAARVEHLFESFNQLDNSTTRKYGGTGLGLTISRRLAEMMGGSMWVESVVDEGSSFYFTIIAQSAPYQEPIYLTTHQPDLNGKRVLIVDDTDTNRQILKLQAESWGMIPVTAESGPAAIAIIQEQASFDLAILDMHMPDMDGLMLAEAIRQKSNTLPLIMLTSLGQQAHDPRMDYFSSFLTKPVKASQLYNTLLGVIVEDAKLVDYNQTKTPSTFNRDMAAQYPLQILLAEDNTINQKLAQLVLERLGYTTDTVANGLEAIVALKRRPYDIILMDIQMPEMDGLTATRRIRQDQTIQRQPYIIAITANAMQGDRDDCLAAGMDNYISKPFQAETLIHALEEGYRHKQNIDPSAPTPSPTPPKQQLSPLPPIPDSPQTPAPTNTTPPPPSTESNYSEENMPPTDTNLIDPAALNNMRTLLGPQADMMLPILVGKYYEEAPKLMDAIRQHHTTNQPAELRRAAHTLKSNSANFGASRVATIAKQMESDARDEKLDNILTLLAEAETEFEKAKTALQELI
ncbi:MAG TPA: response regulator [Anaerolineae bacterium]|nr:response regulator [Anaerolineae bacterium]